jgi:hypothetical protein
VVNIGVETSLRSGSIWFWASSGKSFERAAGKIDIKLHPELYRLLEDDETLEQF